MALLFFIIIGSPVLKLSEGPVCCYPPICTSLNQFGQISIQPKKKLKPPSSTFKVISFSDTTIRSPHGHVQHHDVKALSSSSSPPSHVQVFSFPRSLSQDILLLKPISFAILFLSSPQDTHHC